MSTVTTLVDNTCDYGGVQGQRTPPKVKREVVRLWRAGETQVAIASAVRLDRGTVKAIINGVRSNSGEAWVEAGVEVEVPAPRLPEDWCAAAVEALGDRSGFLFCKRYLGIELSPFQQVSWRMMEDLWDSENREFLAENGPPGGGKTTGKIGFAAKRIVLNRAVRVLFISRATSLAERNTMKLRRLLERTAPAVGAASTLAMDFGRFRPAVAGDVWRRGEFVVEQVDGTPIEEKEPTVSAFGFDSEWLGNRIELVIGDDLDSQRSMSNVETVERNRQIFDDELEPRLESGGLFVITQQRLGPSDFSAHVLSKQVMVDDDGVSDDLESSAKYRHLVFKAHYEDRCRGRETHRPDAPPWPEGCLLDPRKLTWRDLRAARGSNPRRFEVVYQQSDVDMASVLVHPLWVSGGKDPDTGEVFPGCWDPQRGIGELPAGVSGPVFSVASTDPSPTKMWAHEWWCFTPDTFELRFLMDLHRAAMQVPDVLTWDPITKRWSGLMEEWWQRSVDVGRPITHWIFEWNAAQRFFTESDVFRLWARQRNVQPVAHTTGRNKSDPQYGVQMLGPLWRFGKVRLPGRPEARLKSLKLVDEVTRWMPGGAGGGTDDCVMSEWMFENKLPDLSHVPRKHSRQRRPSWMREEVSA